MDPRNVDALQIAEKADAGISALLRAKRNALKGQKVNACPFGCKEEELDDHGYCRHLVGFTNDGETYEPMVIKRGQRVVQVPRDKIRSSEMDEDGKNSWAWGKPKLPTVRKTDQLVKISTSSRVYRDVDKEAPQEPSEPPKIKGREKG